MKLWNHADKSPIRLTDLEAVRDIVKDSLDRSFFGPRFN